MKNFVFLWSGPKRTAKIENFIEFSIIQASRGVLYTRKNTLILKTESEIVIMTSCFCL